MTALLNRNPIYSWNVNQEEINKFASKLGKRITRMSLMRGLMLLVFVCGIVGGGRFTYLAYSCHPGVHTLPAVIVLKSHFSKEYVDEIFYFIRGYKVWI